MRKVRKIKKKNDILEDKNLQQYRCVILNLATLPSLTDTHGRHNSYRDVQVLR